MQISVIYDLNIAWVFYIKRLNDAEMLNANLKWIQNGMQIGTDPYNWIFKLSYLLTIFLWIFDQMRNVIATRAEQVIRRSGIPGGVEVNG